jgi:drug/metabolite transporter (DMT)-like permease
VVYLLAIGSALFYGAADFAGGLTTRRAGTIPVLILSQFSGLTLLVLILPLLPQSSPSQADLFWGGVAGLTGGIGVALLYRALAIGIMGVVAPTTAVCAVAIPVVASLLLGERPAPLALAGIALGIVSIVLVSQQQAAAQPEPHDRHHRAGAPRVWAPRSPRASRSASSSWRSPRPDPVPGCGRWWRHAWSR